MDTKKVADEIITAAKKDKASSLKGFSTDIENDTIKNKNFRQVLYTGNNMQLVVMSLKPGEDIGDEIHGVDHIHQQVKLEEFFEGVGNGEIILHAHT